MSNYHTFYIFWCFINLFKIISTISDPNGEANLQKFPSTVAILVYRAGVWSTAGTGTLLTKYYVLGSRLYSMEREPYPLEKVKIIAGVVDTKLTNPFQLRRVDYMFSRIELGDPHGVPLEMYRVSQPFDENQLVKSANIDYNSPIPPGWRVSAAGWGDGERRSNVLKWGSWDVQSQGTCQDKYSSIPHFCLASLENPERMFIGNDWGAPIYHDERIIGIASPLGVFRTNYTTAIKLGPYRRWIVRNLKWNGVSPNNWAYDPKAYKEMLMPTDERRLRSLKSKAGRLSLKLKKIIDSMYSYWLYQKLKGLRQFEF